VTIKQTRLAAALVVSLAACSCGGPTDPSKNQTETFSGSVQPLGVASNTFNVSNLGEISVSLTSLTPGNIALGIGYGQPSGNGCGLIQSNAVGNTNIGRTVLTGQILIKGTYCVSVFDPSGVLLNIAPWTVAQNYGVSVSHP
jgi:hypothetical protein